MLPCGLGEKAQQRKAGAGETGPVPVAPDLAWPGNLQVEVASPISESLAVAGAAPSSCHSAPTYGTELKQRVPANVLA